ncbi:hypothetical protein [Brumimicrobium aurantiacum]|uniref:Uncharacterized protein n=1 Tax=Brumimicrobium aurantiacum TaxID=1737063 RepID=A0A3E1EWK2_9FLAO|nr:hypothetical protein [Brumimicrobium aurantiacum]RFC53898.1 hypothetical protein DXU93_10140 [Brumimicrobium aurantiacum]
MKRREIRREAYKFINSGESKQTTFELMKQMSNLDDETIADTIKNIPTLEQRKELKTQMTFYLILTFLFILSTIFLSIQSLIQNGILSFISFLLIPIIVSVLSYGAIKFYPRAIDAINFCGIIFIMIVIPRDSFDFIQIHPLLLLLPFIAYLIFGSFLSNKLTQDYVKKSKVYYNKQGQKRLKYEIEFVPRKKKMFNF